MISCGMPGAGGGGALQGGDMENLPIYWELRGGLGTTDLLSHSNPGLLKY